MDESSSFLYNCENTLALILDQKKRATYVCTRTLSISNDNNNAQFNIINNLDYNKCMVELYSTYEKAKSFRQDIINFINVLDAKKSYNNNNSNIIKKQKHISFLLIRILTNIEKESIIHLNKVQNIIAMN